MKEFKDLTISTRTVMAYLNCSFDLVKVSSCLLKYLEQEKDVDKNYDGRIIDIRMPLLKSLKNENEKQKIEEYNKKSKKLHFKNQITVKMYVDNKIITAKIFRTGKFHLTGCKTENHRILGSVLLYKKIIELSNKEDPCLVMEGDKPTIILDIVMTNLDFSLGFRVDQIKLNDIIHDLVCVQDEKQKQYITSIYSIFDPSIQTSVNLKMEYPDPDIKIYEKITIQEDGTFEKTQIQNIDGVKKADTRTHTFLIFNSGKVIQSGRFYFTHMEEAYNKFMNIIQKYKKDIALKDEIPVKEKDFVKSVV